MTASYHLHINRRPAQLVRLIASCFSLIAVLWLHVSGQSGMLHHSHAFLHNPGNVECVHDLLEDGSCAIPVEAGALGLENEDNAQLESKQLRCKQPRLVAAIVERRVEAPSKFYTCLPQWRLGQIAMTALANIACSRVHVTGSSFGKDWICTMAQTVVLRL